jgi:hypothetical protein
LRVRPEKDCSLIVRVAPCCAPLSLCSLTYVMITMSAICMWMLSVTQASPTVCVLVRAPPACVQGLRRRWPADPSVVACAQSVVCLLVLFLSCGL